MGPETVSEFVEHVNSRDLEGCLRLLSPAFRDYDPIQLDNILVRTGDLRFLVRVLEGLFEPNLGFSLHIEELFGTKDRVACRLFGQADIPVLPAAPPRTLQERIAPRARWQAAHDAPGVHLAGSSRPVTFACTSIFALEAEKIVARWGRWRVE